MIYRGTVAHYRIDPNIHIYIKLYIYGASEKSNRRTVILFSRKLRKKKDEEIQRQISYHESLILFVPNRIFNNVEYISLFISTVRILSSFAVRTS